MECQPGTVAGEIAILLAFLCGLEWQASVAREWILHLLIQPGLQLPLPLLRRQQLQLQFASGEIPAITLAWGTGSRLLCVGSCYRLRFNLPGLVCHTRKCRFRCSQQLLWWLELGFAACQSWRDRQGIVQRLGL